MICPTDPNPNLPLICPIPRKEHHPAERPRLPAKSVSKVRITWRVIHAARLIRCFRGREDEPLHGLAAAIGKQQNAGCFGVAPGDADGGTCRGPGDTSEPG